MAAATENPTLLRLNASQKLAAFLVVMGEDAAAEILKNFDDNERELVCAEMANLPLLDSNQQGAVLQEFTEMAVEARSGISGSVDFTRAVLEKVFTYFLQNYLRLRISKGKTLKSKKNNYLQTNPLFEHFSPYRSNITAVGS